MEKIQKTRKLWKGVKTVLNQKRSKSNVIYRKHIWTEYSGKIIIEVKNISKSFTKINFLKSVRSGHKVKEERVIFKNLNFNVYEGEKLAFLGSNGCGKTLTIEAISGVSKVNSGQIIYHFGKGVRPYNKIGVQYQVLEFPSGLTVKDIINFIIKLNNVKVKNFSEFTEILEVFQLDKTLNIPATKLSGGQQQRLNVFLAMIDKPKVLFLDEYTTGLDIAIKKDIQKFILKFCKKHKITFCFVSHDIDTIEELCDRIILLSNQEILIDLPLSEINRLFGSIKKMIDIYIN